ncbi:MAG: DMT family transporter [bacterium]|nr:DMT family transporter [bacterium]
MTSRTSGRQPYLGLSPPAFGLLITVVGVLVLSAEGVLIRSIEVDSWTLLFLRGVFAAPGLFLFFLVVERRGWRHQLRSMGLAGLLAAVLFAIDNVGFIYSITHTSVANTLLLISLSPLFAGLFTRMVLRETVPRRTWLAIAGGSVATLIIMVGSLVEGDLPGTLAGLVAAAAIGGTLVVLRARPHLNMVPAVALGSGLAALVGLPASTPSSASPEDWMYLVALGLIVVPVAFGLIATGPRYIPAAEVALFLLLETVLGALWVWWAIGEAPTIATVVGGVILVVVLAAHSVATLRSRGHPSTEITT